MGAKASETAMMTASLRALACYEDDALMPCKDFLSEIFLPDDKRQQLKDIEVRAMIKKLIPEGLYEYVIARTRWFDALFMTALDEDIPQIVMLGAGYDSRPYRFEEQIRTTLIYELDAPATSHNKQDILRQNNVTSHKNIRYVPVDFEQHHWMDSLCNAGYKPELRTVFIWEGVTFYLSPDTVDAMLQLLKQYSAVGSLLCFDYQTVDGSQGLIDTGLKNEAIRFAIPAGTTVDYLEKFGYTVREQVDSEEMCRRYLTLSNNSFFGSIKSMMNFVKAEMT